MRQTNDKPSFEELFSRHSADDRESFAKIDARNTRFELLLGQMGEHLSFLRKDMNIIAESQNRHTEDSITFRKAILETMEKIKHATDPLVKEAADDKIRKAQVVDWGENGIAFFKAILTIGAACTMIWAVVKYIIFRAMQ